MSSTDALHDPLETLCVEPLHLSASVSMHAVLCRPHGKKRGPDERPLLHQIVFPHRASSRSKRVAKP